MLKTIWNGINKVYVRHNHANRNKSSVMTILAFTFFNPKLQECYKLFKNAHDNVFNILCKHEICFEMNLTKIRYFFKLL